MKYPNVNIFAAWFFMPHTVAMGWVAAAGGLLLGLFGLPVEEGDVPSRLVGALLLFVVLFLIWYVRGSLPPQGDPQGKGYAFGHRLVLAGNLFAAALFVFQFFTGAISDYNTHLVLDKFTTAFGYWCMGCFAVGFSLIYQSSLASAQA